MNKEKQIIEIKECIDAVYGADCAYFDVDGFAIANEIFNAGYRKQSEGEWELGKSGVMSFCSTCGYWAHPREVDEWDYCPRCGAKMREEDDGK